MKKTTKEYAEKLANIHAREYYETSDSRYSDTVCDYVIGYLSAIEENAVPELIEALEEVTEALRFVEFESGDHGQDTEMFQKAKAALKKATS